VQKLLGGILLIRNIKEFFAMVLSAFDKMAGRKLRLRDIHLAGTEFLQ